jgi:ArsR family transcriptional regulator
MIASTSQPASLMSLMESLADQTRLRLLCLLERQELGVAELCEVMQMPQSTVSRHLKLLAEQGWISSRRRGTTNLYRMTLDELEEPARRLWLLTREQTADWAALEQDRIRLKQVLTHRDRDTKAFFEGAVEQWDKLRHELYGERSWLAALLALLPSDWTVADLGCGTGTVTASLAGHVAKVLAVDQSEQMLEAAGHRLGATEHVELRRGDLESLPIESRSCDAALLVLVLTYLPDPEPALRESARVLKRGGKLVMLDIMRHDDDAFRRQMGQHSLGFDRTQMTSLLRTAGLTPQRSEPLTPVPDAKGPALLLGTATRP